MIPETFALLMLYWCFTAALLLLYWRCRRHNHLSLF
jgi:hypothetical protein